MIKAKYKAQVNLLLQVLPFVAKEEMFALKGGTAISPDIRETRHVGLRKMKTSIYNQNYCKHLTLHLIGIVNYYVYFLVYL